MNSIEEFVKQQKAQRRWSPQVSLRRIALRTRRMFKRRLRGESHRQWIERNLNDSEAGICFDLLQCVISLSMVLSIIAQNWTGSNFVREESYRIIDIINLVAITINFGLRYFAASNRKAHCLHWLSVVDVFCWVALVVEATVPNDDSRQGKYEYRFFLMIRTVRLLQIFRLRRLAKTAKARQSMLIALTGMCILICAAAAFQTIEYCDMTKPQSIDGENCQNLSFFDSIYFVCITIGTVGYGEYAPKTKVGKVADIFLIIFTGVLIPTQISGLTDILSRETAFDKKYIPDKRVQHILLCGNIENSSLKFFLHSWLHGEGERGNRRKVIILSPTLPSSSVRRVLLHREYEQRVLYLQGSAMDAADLQRAGAQSAAYCFVMVNKHSRSLDQDDTATNLVTCSIRKNNRHAPLYVQVSRADNIRHINISGASAVVCLEQLKLSLFAKSLWIRGLNAFLGNIVQRFDIRDDKGGFWLKDYLGGCCHRIYEASIPSFLFAMPTFRSLAILVYREFSAPLVGIRTLQESVMVYPMDKDLNDIGFHSVFFLSKSRETISKIEKMSNAVFVRHPDISPNVDVSSGKSSRTITGVLNSMAVGNPFQRLSMVLLTDHHANSVARFSSTGRPSGRNSDKITPLDGDDAGDSENGGNQTSRIHNKDCKVPAMKHTRHPSSIGDDDSDFDPKRAADSDVDSADLAYSPPTLPVISLSPAELMKKATSPLSPREITSRPIVTPRTPRTARATPPSRCEAPQSPKVSSSRTGTHPASGPTTPSTPILSDQLGNVQSLEDPSDLPPTIGPLVSTIEGAQPDARTKTSPQEPVQQRAGEDEDTVALKNLRGTTRGGPPTLRRESSKRDQHRPNRPSQYKSFRRRAPPQALTGHYVVCGVPSNYSFLIASLKDLDEENTSVVFVTPGDLSERDFSAYVEFKNVFFVRGSPVSMEAFEEARMAHAKSILITSYCGQVGGGDRQTDTEQFDENMADVDAITTHRFISEACQNYTQRNATTQPAPTKHRSSWLLQLQIPYIVVEMMRPSNVKFLVDRSGSLYDENSAANEVRARDLLRDAHALDDSFFTTLYAGGHVYFSNFMDALLGSSSQNSFLIDMVTQLVISGNSGLSQLDREARSRHRLTQISAPARYHNRPYALLVEGLMVNENTIALGVYRAAHGFVAPAYVMTNPAPNELVHAHDLIFVIK